MRRAELSKRYLIIGLVLILVLTIPGAVIKAVSSTEYIKGSTLSRVTGEYGTMTDRNGGLLYDGSILNVPVFGNLISSPINSNSLYMAYRSYLSPSGFNPIAGLDSVKGKKGGEVKTTLLDASLQQLVADAFQGKNGCCFCYNYVTGEVYTALSFPCNVVDMGVEDGSLQNRCFDSVYIPGSTMKIVASICAVEQDRSLLQTEYYCDASLELADGNSVNCPGIHYQTDFVSGIGNSCNGYFATVIQQFDVEKTVGILEKMGITVNGDAGLGSIDKLVKKNSSTKFTTNVKVNDLWSLIGQGGSAMNAVDMARIAGAVANGGKAAQPYIVQDVTEPDSGKKLYKAGKAKTDELFSKKTAETVEEFWSAAADKYYELPETISYAKTGTAEKNDYNKTQVNRMLLGVCKESNAAFMIIVEDSNYGEVFPQDIAEVLASVLPK